MPGDRLGVGHAIPQPERALEVALRDLVGVEPLGADPGAHVGAERAVELVRATSSGRRARRRPSDPATSPSSGAVGLERLGEPRVQAAVLAGQQVAVDRLADQRVAERVVAVGVDHEHLVGDRLARALHHLVRRQVGDRLEQRVRGRPVGTAAIRTTAWAVGESRSTRAISTSRSVSGSSQLSPSSLAASSSSV